MAHVFHVNTNWPVGTLDDMHVWWRLMFSKLTISLDSARTEQCFVPIFNLLYLCIYVYLYQGYTKIRKIKIVLIPQNIRALLCTHGIKVRDAKSTTTKKKKECSAALQPGLSLPPEYNPPLTDVGSSPLIPGIKSA